LGEHERDERGLTRRKSGAAPREGRVGEKSREKTATTTHQTKASKKRRKEWHLVQKKRFSKGTASGQLRRVDDSDRPSERKRVKRNKNKKKREKEMTWRSGKTV